MRIQGLRSCWRFIHYVCRASPGHGGCHALHPAEMGKSFETEFDLTKYQNSKKKRNKTKQNLGPTFWDSETFSNSEGLFWVKNMKLILIIMNAEIAHWQLQKYILFCKKKRYFWKRLFFFNLFCWSVEGLQCCVNFCCTAKWFSCVYTYILFHILSIMAYHRILNTNPLCYTVEPCHLWRLRW